MLLRMEPSFLDFAVSEGTLWDIKNFSKKSHSAEKNQKGDSLVPSGFVGYLEKVKNESGEPLH